MVCRRLRLTSGGLGEFKSADEFKLIHDEAAKMQAYGRQAKDMELIRLATEIRMRAVRLLGQLMAKQRDAGMMAIGTRGNIREVLTGGSKVVPPDMDKPAIITLEQAGIDKHLADKARKFAARTDEEFETFVGKALQKVTDGIEGRLCLVHGGDFCRWRLCCRLAWVRFRLRRLAATDFDRAWF
jgi:hypothetical protein